MDDASAQSSKNTYGEEHTTQSPHQTIAPTQSSHTQSPVTSSVSNQPVSAPQKEHAPLTEHLQVTDPLEAQPQLHPEVKEAGVDVRQDEARLDLTREHQGHGMQHSPPSTPVIQHIQGQKQDFPMSYETATIAAKKESVWNPLRWLATLVLKQMKIKQLNDQKK